MLSPTHTLYGIPFCVPASSGILLPIRQGLWYLNDISARYAVPQCPNSGEPAIERRNEGGRVSRLLSALVLASSFAIAMSVSADEVSAPDPAVGKLVVVPVGLEKNQGSVMIRLANDEADFEADDEAFRSATVKVEDKRAVAVFEDVPHGEYAIKVFHDENSNQKLDTNFVGYPQEGFGFSNDAMGRFGPPGFEAAKFYIGSDELRIEINSK
jgi:uncharacterized protein (DUF2141 family)